MNIALDNRTLCCYRYGVVVIPSDKKFALARILRAWRVKIRRALEPGSGLNFWHVLNCNRRELVEHIERFLRPPMTWDNYGTVWTMTAKDARVVETLDDFYLKFDYKNYIPTLKVQPGRPQLRQPKST